MATMGMSHCKCELHGAIGQTTWVAGLQVQQMGIHTPTGRVPACRVSVQKVNHRPRWEFLQTGELLYFLMFKKQYYICSRMC